MPRRKQQNPQPVKSDSEYGLGTVHPASLTFESDFLLGQELEYPDNDNNIIGLEKFSADISLSGFPLGDEESSPFSRLSMESDADDLRMTESEREERVSESAFPSYLSCRGCGQLLDDPLGPSIDLVGPYCIRCCKGVVEERKLCSGLGLYAESRRGGNESAGGKDGSLKLHSCKLCGFTSRYTNHVKRHMKTHNGEKPYECPLCSYASAQLVNLKRHLRIHTGEKPYKCNNCSFACSSLGNLKRHQRMHAAASPAQNGPPPMRGNSLNCTAVGQREKEVALVPSEDAVQSESRPHMGRDGSYMQTFDGLRSAQQSSAAVLQSGQAASEPSAQPPMFFPFTCRLCGMALDDEDGSSAQICAKCTLEMLTKDTPGCPTERGDKVYTCATCSFLTHYPNHLARHMKTHSGEKPYKCPQCDYASAHFDNLKRHHRVHTGEKPYKCHLCDYACGNLANLKRHQRVHSGAKPFQCTICSYSCNQSMNLKRHMLRHTGEKPHKCQECGYTTGHWDNYKRHQKKHSLATDGWVKIPMPGNEEDVEDEEEV
ncbi:zinc finger protein 513-like [Myxocyprinus asiaticus]|uniref:zinc finger protein 513-like n=1 Tax=Myxocyprinus asiaticus TaxID=70543 RepID=UPI00222282DC|nr:zinc finger protein 513-like [Myxocyprinus asiaticus]XP_051510921.1 zinc finger protein 513-like [Myxocyprinus asiaticus]XP_051510922.1 zinc finger protein 513-like [Myxocyprinus asiaticus]XP_051510923.1 zinc finger protein 513-like [Myxocyprinus asiaticus]XP_051510924.1 zinc finger protein 513-like [Myxocyprinus asiaticus]XP_051510925.1 zinc finger protein 513-like [Myxocyprinus asiaticus]